MRSSGENGGKNGATIAEALKEAGERLRAASVPNDLLDAQTLLAEALGKDRTYLIINFNQQLSEGILSAFRTMVDRRAAGEPLQYITGRQEFFGLDFEVTPDVLIPRPETEILVEAALELLDPNEEALVCDVGVGSGCIIVSLLHERKTSCAYGLDISKDALKVAARNAARHG